jgi:hypothetical protein
MRHRLRWELVLVPFPLLFFDALPPYLGFAHAFRLPLLLIAVLLHFLLDLDAIVFLLVVCHEIPPLLPFRFPAETFSGRA